MELNADSERQTESTVYNPQAEESEGEREEICKAHAFQRR